jgi:hypothetical protein
MTCPAQVTNDGFVQDGSQRPKTRAGKCRVSGRRKRSAKILANFDMKSECGRAVSPKQNINPKRGASPSDGDPPIAHAGAWSKMPLFVEFAIAR